MPLSQWTWGPLSGSSSWLSAKRGDSDSSIWHCPIRTKMSCFLMPFRLGHHLAKTGHFPCLLISRALPFCVQFLLWPLALGPGDWWPCLDLLEEETLCAKALIRTHFSNKNILITEIPDVLGQRSQCLEWSRPRVSLEGLAPLICLGFPTQSKKNAYYDQWVFPAKIFFSS